MTELLGDKMYNPYWNLLEPIYNVFGKKNEEADLLKVLFGLPLEVRTLATFSINIYIYNLLKTIILYIE